MEHKAMSRYLTRSWLLGLLGVLWAVPAAWAQDYPAVGPETGAPRLYARPPSGVEEIAPGVRVVIDPSELPRTGGVVVGGPLDGPQGHHVHGKECVPVPATRTKIRIEYGSVDIDYCLTKCGPHGCKGDCKDGHCGKPRRKHYLMKRVVATECPITQCVPVCKEHPAACAPSCPTAVMPPANGAAPAQAGAPTAMMSAPLPGSVLTLSPTTPITPQPLPSGPPAATAPR
jgi:hypothetical protein